MIVINIEKESVEVVKKEYKGLKFYAGYGLYLNQIKYLEE